MIILKKFPLMSLDLKEKKRIKGVIMDNEVLNELKKMNIYLENMDKNIVNLCQMIENTNLYLENMDNAIVNTHNIILNIDKMLKV